MEPQEKDAGYFYLNNQKMARLNTHREEVNEMVDTLANNVFTHSYLVDKFDVNNDLSPMEGIFNYNAKNESFGKDMEIQSTISVQSQTACQTSDSPKATSFSTNSIVSKIENVVNDSVSLNQSNDTFADTVYKTPNYKNKKRTSVKYMTKHSTVDLELHEQQMQQKYGVKLSVRKDVVFKTLFRALKRFYTEAFLIRFTLDKKESSSSYLHKINHFCIETFSTHLEAMHSWGVTFEQIEKFISIVVSPNHIKDSLKDSTEKVLYKDYYSCLYQYSHKKLRNMLLSPVCGYLFTDFITSGNLTRFISSCSTMSQNPETYQKAGANFISIALGRDKKGNRPAVLPAPKVILI